MIPDLIDTGLTDAEAVEALQRAHRCMTRAETEEQIGHEAAARQDADDVLTAAVAQINAALLDCASQEDLDDAVGAVAAQGAKNLLKITASSQTIKGVTFTVNDDQTVTVNGTNDGTGASTFVIVPNAQAITIPDGNYILSGCPTDGGASAPFDLRWYMYSPGKSAYDSGNGASIEKSGNGTGSNIAIVVKTGQTAHNITFKPMIRRAEITDSTYVPYAPTNRELYEAKTEQAETNVISNLGAKNLLKNVRTTTTHRGVTFTVNEDGSVTASGTNDGTGASLFNINMQSSLALSSGDYILSGCPAGGSETGYFMDITRTSGSSLKDTGSGVGFTVGGTYTVNEFRIVISRSISVSGLVFKPMIRRAEITDDTYVPYAPTNRELYEMILALQAGVSAQSAASLMQAGRLDAAELMDAQEVTDDA